MSLSCFDNGLNITKSILIILLSPACLLFIGCGNHYHDLMNKKEIVLPTPSEIFALSAPVLNELVIENLDTASITLARPELSEPSSSSVEIKAYIGIEGAITVSGGTVSGYDQGPIDVSSYGYRFKELKCNTAYCVIAVVSNEYGYSVRQVGRKTNNVMYVVNASSNTVTYFNPKTGAYINGGLNESSYLGIKNLDNASLNSSANILYVVDYSSNAVIFFNATSGAYYYGDITASTFFTGEAPFASIYNPVTNILYVADNSGKVTYFNGTTGAYINGTLENSSFYTGKGSYDWYNIAVNSTTNILYVINSDNTVLFLNATNGEYINGTINNSSFIIGDQPMGVAVNPISNILYVVNFFSNTVTYLNATTGAYLYDTLVASSFNTGIWPVNVAINQSENILYVLSLDNRTLTYFNATTGDYLYGDGPHGTLEASSFTTGAWPFDLAVNVNENILYVVNTLSNTITFFNATTGDYLFGPGPHGTLEASSFPTGDQPSCVLIAP